MPLTYDNSRIVGGLMPSLDLGFSENDYRLGLKKVGFSDIVTFSRASGGGRFNAQGQYEWLPADQPRFDFDPVTLEPRGILIEEQRTNLLLRSAEFDNSSWTKSGSIVTGNSATAPDGTLTADKLVEVTNDSQHLLGLTVTVTAGSVLIFSVYAKAAERSIFNLRISDGVSGYARKFNVDNGTSDLEDVASTSAATVFGMESVGDGWYRCYVGCTMASGTSSNIQIRLNNGGDGYTGDGTSGIFIWGAQLEAGAFPTSYIPTTTAQVTRAADVCSVNNLSPWYRADEGTLLVEYAITRLGYNGGAATLSDNTLINRMTIRGVTVSSATVTIGVVGGITRWSLGLPAQVGVTVAALAYTENGIRFTRNAAPLQTTMSAPVSRVTRLMVGADGDGGLRLNGHIRSIRYIPRRISDTELQALTAI